MSYNKVRNTVRLRNFSSNFKNGFEFDDKATIYNIELLKNVINYKKGMPKTDAFWRNISNELGQIINELTQNNRNGKKKLREVENLEVKRKLINYLKFIEFNMDQWTQRVKYSKALRPLFRKEKRVRKLIRNILNYLKKGKSTSGKEERKNLFNINKEYGNLDIKGELKKAYNKASNINHYVENNDKLLNYLLKMNKTKFKDLIDEYKEIVGGEMDYDFKTYYQNILNSDSLIKFNENLYEIHKKIKKNLNKTIKKMVEEGRGSRSDCFRLLTFLISYNNFIKEISGGNNGLNNTINKFKRMTSPVKQPNTNNNNNNSGPSNNNSSSSNNNSSSI